jgi:hypothetical protein
MIHQELSDGKCITTHDNGEKMPGPVSDSYDPEFSTSDRATRVREAIMQQRDSITQILGEQLLHIVSVVDDEFEPFNHRRLSWSSPKENYGSFGSHLT